MNFPASIEKNGMERCITFLNESNLIESIKEIDYHDAEYRRPDIGHFGAFILSQQAAEEKKLLDHKQIRQWQALLTREQLTFTSDKIGEDEIGHIRGPNLQKNVRIGNHIPPTWQLVPVALQTLIEDVNKQLRKPEELKDDVAYCKFLGSVFQRFEAIHPFADGNGRTGRLLANYIATFCKRPLLVFNSELREKNRYYKAHESEPAMWRHMAEKIQEAIFGFDGQLLFKSGHSSGSTVEYASQNGDYSEKYEWHKLYTEVGSPQVESSQ